MWQSHVPVSFFPTVLLWLVIRGREHSPIALHDVCVMTHRRRIIKLMVRCQGVLTYIIHTCTFEMPNGARKTTRTDKEHVHCQCTWDCMWTFCTTDIGLLYNVMVLHSGWMMCKTNCNVYIKFVMLVTLSIQLRNVWNTADCKKYNTRRV